jgi:hypothetical protein
VSEDSAPGVPLGEFEALERAAEIEDYDPTVLSQLVAAHHVLVDHMASVDAEAVAATKAVYDTHAAYTATLHSHVYALTAKAHRMGFTIAQLNAVMGTAPEPEEY